MTRSLKKDWGLKSDVQSVAEVLSVALNQSPPQVLDTCGGRANPSIPLVSD